MNVVSIVMLVFCVLGGLDRILGNRFGIGKEFEKGFMLLGAMALSMIGMIVLSPLIAAWLSPCFEWIYRTLHVDPSIIPASLFANDMGGAPLAKEVAQNDALGMFNALVVSSMMGCTISFSIPYALGIVKKDVQKEMFFGMLCGIATIPIGCFIAGLICRIPLVLLLIDLLPLILLAAIIACGLTFAPTITVKIFSVIGVLMRVMITIGLLLGIAEFLTGYTLIEELADVTEGANICFNAAVTLSGAFPLMYIVSKLLAKPIRKFGNALGIAPESAVGLLSTIVTNATTFEMLNRMDKKGVVLNSAFLVSAAFVLGGHLAFTMAFDASYVFAVSIGKLIAGICAVLLAVVLYRRVYKPTN
jgi:ethanolamine transporter